MVFEILHSEGLQLTDLCPNCGRKVAAHERDRDRMARIAASGGKGAAAATVATFLTLMGAGTDKQSDGNELVCEQLLDREKTKSELLEGIAVLAKQRGTKNPLDKRHVPILATVGISGSGKTAICRLIRRHPDPSGKTVSWRDDVWKTIRTGIPATLVDPANPPPDAAPQGGRPLKCLVVLMVSLNQGSSIEDTEIATNAVIYRAFADFVQAPFQRNLSAMLPPQLLTIDALLRTVRQMEAVKPQYGGTVQPEEVAVMLLLDETRKIDETLRDGATQRSKLLDSLASLQQSELEQGRLFLPFVTSLRMASFYAMVTETKRPVIGVTLPPLLSAEAQDVILQTLYKKFGVSKDTFDDDPDFSCRAWIDMAVAAAAGHPGTLSSLLEHNFSNGAFDYTKKRIDPVTANALLECHLDSLAEVKVPESPEVHNLLREGRIMPVRPDFKDLTFIPRPLPSALALIKPSNCYQANAPARFVQEAEVMGSIYKLLNLPENLAIHFEQVIPMVLELKARAVVHTEVADAFSAVVSPAATVLRPGHTRLVVRSDVVSTQSVTPYRLSDIASKCPLDHCYRVFARCQNEAGIEGFTHMCAAETSSGQTVNVRFAWQMKLYSKITAAKFAAVVESGFTAMRDLNFDLSRDYLVLCISTAIPSTVDLKALVPHGGLIVLGPEGCQDLLQPYGWPPLMTVIHYKSNKR